MDDLLTIYILEYIKTGPWRRLKNNQRISNNHAELKNADPPANVNVVRLLSTSKENRNKHISAEMFCYLYVIFSSVLFSALAKKPHILSLDKTNSIL
jgi:hypothetical protein